MDNSASVFRSDLDEGTQRVRYEQHLRLRFLEQQKGLWGATCASKPNHEYFLKSLVVEAFRQHPSRITLMEVKQLFHDIDAEMKKSPNVDPYVTIIHKLAAHRLFALCDEPFTNIMSSPLRRGKMMHAD